MSKLKYYFKETLEWVAVIIFCFSIPALLGILLVLLGQFFGISK